jgi:glycerol-3-phosphate dehydrogenase
MVQGSHIVVPKLYAHDRCYIFQNGDGRIVFAIPYQGDFTLIGTTDRDYHGDPAEVAASDEEIAYLCGVASEYFAKPVVPEAVAWSYSGVRPLYDDGAPDAKAATRDYVLELDAPQGQPALLSVFGGKITTYRRLAEAALAKLGGHMPERISAVAGWTARTALPGGDFPVQGFDAEVAALCADYPFLTAPHATRLTHAYGRRARQLLGAARTQADLGRMFGATLSEAEIRYLQRAEWAQTAEDILWRRSKLGLHMSPDEIAAVTAFLRGSA